jgi:hypothetical protein
MRLRRRRGLAGGQAMSKYADAAVPFKTQGNRRYLTDRQLVENPELARFVSRFSQCFEADPLACAWWFHPDGESSDPSGRPQDSG